MDGLRTCAYCGAEATDREHVTPRSYLNRVQDFAVVTTAIIPACSDRNRSLSKAKKRLLATPDWSDSELAHLSELLRHHVLVSLAERDFTRERLRVLSLPGSKARSAVRPFGKRIYRSDIPKATRAILDVCKDQDAAA